MTLKTLLHWGGLGEIGKGHGVPVERWHGNSGSWEQKSHGHGQWKGSSSKGGGSSAALSALSLLAFLFFLNIMQQSLNDNNNNMMPPTTVPPTAVVLRDEIGVLSARGRDMQRTHKSENQKTSQTEKDEFKKGDTFGRDDNK